MNGEAVKIIMGACSSFCTNISPTVPPATPDSDLEVSFAFWMRHSEPWNISEAWILSECVSGLMIGLERGNIDSKNTYSEMHSPHSRQ